ncbi:MAG: hypothetical protein OHK0013_46640 [Sandaracinaceae bacterium]
MNAALFGAAIDVLRLEGASPALVAENAADLSRMISGDDVVMRAVFARLQESVSALDSIFRGEGSVAQERLALAKTVRAAAALSGEVRAALEVLEAGPSGVELLVEVRDGEAGSVAWLRSSRLTPETAPTSKE